MLFEWKIKLIFLRKRTLNIRLMEVKGVKYKKVLTPKIAFALWVLERLTILQYFLRNLQRYP